VQKLTRTTKLGETFEEGDIFKFFDQKIEKEVLIVAAIHIKSPKEQRLLTICLTREIGEEWDNDFFVCNAKRFTMLEKKPKTPFPLDANVVNSLVSTQFIGKTCIKETNKTRTMWSQINSKVNNVHSFCSLSFC
jgi:hypothetical protein